MQSTIQVILWVIWEVLSRLCTINLDGISAAASLVSVVVWVYLASEFFAQGNPVVIREGNLHRWLLNMGLRPTSAAQEVIKASKIIAKPHYLGGTLVSLSLYPFRPSKAMVFIATCMPYRSLICGIGAVIGLTLIDRRIKLDRIRFQKFLEAEGAPQEIGRAHV